MGAEMASVGPVAQRVVAASTIAGLPSSNGSFYSEVSNVYDTVEFHLYVRKIISCSKRFAHEWTTCPFAHPGEKAKRRDPRTHQYDCEMCPAVVKGEVCELGTACPHSHHVFESWLHPQKFRTMLCKDGDACHREVCFFAHGAEQLRIPSRDLPYTPLAGPSRLQRQSAPQQEQDEPARQASAGATAAGGSGYGMPTPHAAAASAVMAAAQSNAKSGGSGSSGSRHVRFSPQQSTRGMPAGQAGVTCSMIMGGSCSNGLPLTGTTPGMEGAAMTALPYADSMAGSSRVASGEFARLQALASMASTGNSSSSGCWATSLLPSQQDSDSRRSSLCEMCTSGMTIVPAMMRTLPINNTEQLAGGALSPGVATQQQVMQAGIAGNVGLDMNDVSMLVSSLVQEIKTTRQEAVESRYAAAQAQEQLRAITGAWAKSQDTAVPDAALAAAMPSSLAGDVLAAASEGDATSAACQQRLQQKSESLCAAMGSAALLSSTVAGSGCSLEQLALLEQLQRAGMVMPTEAAAPGLNHAGLGSCMQMSLQQAMSDNSNISTSRSRHIDSDSALSCAASTAPGPGADARHSFETVSNMSAEHAGLPRVGSLDHASAAAASMATAGIVGLGSPCMSRQARGMQTGISVMPSSYPIAAGNSGAGEVMDWLQLLNAASGRGATAAGLMPQLPNLGCNFDNANRPNALASTGNAAMLGLLSNSNMQQQQPHQQQLQSDYLLQLQGTHGLLSAPELAFLMPPGPAQQDQLQQQQQQQCQVQSAAAVLQGWGRSDIQDCISSSGTMEALVGPANDVAASLNATGGSRQLGWL